MSATRKAASAADVRFMRRALALASRGLGRTAPNPPVGAVFVRGGRVVGEGFTAPAGGPHAEIRALAAAAARARGADLYVTLEPCAHHGRTPPCVDALLPLGLRRVVVATRDPNPAVRGRSLRRLRAAGVRVTVGPGADEAKCLMAGYLSRVERGRPFVTLKLATTLDGRIATRTGDARWITGEPARRRVHALRNVSDAVLVGAGTVRADDPELTCRTPGGRNPIRIVLTGSRLAVPWRSRVLRVADAPTWLVAPVGAPLSRVRELRRRGVHVVLLPGRRGRLGPGAVLRALAARGIGSLLVEGGASVAGDWLRAGVVDRVVWFVAPMILGGDAVPAVGPLRIARMAGALVFDDVAVEQVGPDVMVTARSRPVRGRRPFASAGPAR